MSKKYNFTEDQIELMRRALSDHPHGDSLQLGTMVADYEKLPDITVWECTGEDMVDCDLDEVRRMREELKELSSTFGGDMPVKDLMLQATSVPPRYHDPYEVLREFVEDMKLFYGTGYGDELDEGAQEESYDLTVTYQHALECLAWAGRARVASDNPIRIKRWLSLGKVGVHHDFSSLLVTAGEMLDQSGATDLFGTVLFVSEDDKTFLLSCEGVIVEADEKYVEDFLAKHPTDD